MRKTWILSDPYQIVALLFGILSGYMISEFSYSFFYEEMDAHTSMWLGMVYLFIVPLVMACSLLVLFVIATITGKYTRVASFSLVVSLLVAMISNQIFYKHYFIDLAYNDLNIKILKSNGGQEPKTDLYAQFKKDREANNYDRLLEYKTPETTGELLSTSKENIYLLKLSGESLKNPVLKEKYKEIIADNFVSEQEYQTFKNLVVSIEIDKVFSNKLTFKERKND